MTSPAGSIDNHPPPSSPIRFDLVNVALAAAVVLLVYSAFVFLQNIGSVIVLLAISIILATAIEPVAFALVRRGLQQSYGVLLIYLILVTAIGVFLAIAARILAEELLALVIALPSGLRHLEVMASDLPAGPVRDTAVSAVSALASAAARPGAAGFVTSGTVSGLVFATYTLVEAVFAAVTVLVIAYFWLAERSTIRRWVLHLVPDRYRETVLIVWETVEFRLGAWSRGQLVLMFLVGLIQGVGYTVLGLPFALLLGVWAGLAEVIPMIGPYLGAAPALIVALTLGPRYAVIVALFALVVNMIEANVLIPRIMQYAVGLSPLTVIVALLVGAAVGGILGALLAVPIAAAIQAALAELAVIRSYPRG